MRILLAPDSFKGSLTALEVARALKRGLKRADPYLDIDILPMADGGEGTVRSLTDATGGKILKKRATGPLGDKVQAFFGILGDGRTAVIEMAAASGLPLIPAEKRNPLQTTTYGTGELIKAALDEGCEKLIIGIGGSATNDCGIGMAGALGVRFLNASGEEVPLVGGALQDIESIDLSGLDSRVSTAEIQVACDVDNPLYGENGAAYVYGPQKGATPAMVEELDRGLRHLAGVMERDLGIKVAELPGAGAAGGLGAGLVAFLGAELKPGMDIVIEATGLEERVRKADLVITGEGAIDAQTINGKVPVGVARVAKKYSLPVIGIAGTIGDGAAKVYEYGIDALFSIIRSPVSLEEAVGNSAGLLEDLAFNLGRILIVTGDSGRDQKRLK